MVFPLGHACTGCGGSCRGVRVRVLSEEVEPLRARAAELGVDAPLDGDRLGFVDGACVFLDGARCRLHARFGPAAKPVVCRQYPLVVLDTESGRRVGLDPGCYTAALTRAAPPLATCEVVASRSALDAAVVRQEAAVLARLEGVVTLPAALAAVGAAPGFEARWLATLRRAPLGALVARPDAGDSVRAALAGPLEAVHALDAPPPLALDAEQEDWAVDVARRMVALRLCPTFPVVPGVALLTLGGALLASWSDPTPGPFGATLAAWTRALRAPAFWSTLVPGPDALRALVSGAE